MKIIKFKIEAVVADDADEALVKHAASVAVYGCDCVKYCEIDGGDGEFTLESKPTAVLYDGTGAPVAKAAKPKRKYTRHVKTDAQTGDTVVTEVRT